MAVLTSDSALRLRPCAELEASLAVAGFDCPAALGQR